MPPYLRILPRETYDLVPVEVVQKSGVDFAGELVEELVEKLDVDEHRRRVGELACDDVEERFRAEEITLGACFTPLGFESS